MMANECQPLIDLIDDVSEFNRHYSMDTSVNEHIEAMQMLFAIGHTNILWINRAAQIDYNRGDPDWQEYQMAVNEWRKSVDAQ